jgi:hypothetical protein
VLIVSKFHDYYDSIKTFGIDKSIVYNRKTEVIKENIFDINKNFVFDFINDHFYYRNFRYLSNQPKITKFKISICGTLYNGLCYDNKFYYKLETFLQAVQNFNNAYFQEFVQRNKHISSNFEIKDSEKLFNKHIEYKTPIFTFREMFRNEKIVEKDSCLKEFNFEKIIDPFTMFQKIQQFISGVLTNIEKEPWPISDKLKAESHGYDKFSFRKLEHQRKTKPR